MNPDCVIIVDAIQAGVCLYGVGIFTWWWATVRSATSVYVLTTLTLLGFSISNIVEIWGHHVLIIAPETWVGRLHQNWWYEIRDMLTFLSLTAIIILMTFRMLTSIRLVTKMQIGIRTPTQPQKERSNMDKMLSILLALAVAAAMIIVSSCAPVVSVPNPMVPNEACSAHLDALTAGKAGPSLIRQKIPNPCDAYRILATLSSVGVVWDVYKAGQVIAWLDQSADIVRSGVSYADLNVVISAKINAINRKFGGTYLLFSGLLVQFDQASMITEADQAILLAAIEGLKADAKRLALVK